ncbi:SEC-C domain-containing protein [Actinoplanes awajinensis]|uniref:SEC-C motif-containing protein n=1 Tax=Actinoplanes awajinensis subsp. mycoplanecinus TaxID=135947 RepID=A0A101JJF3_9ACTN|nr:SEC-C domain-containing protein [Actinoplanes awajinensis]KUL27998.1 hypothetical protein ADL15_32850 [Actinoplanes awajinensis subsp. mycoplanecinus]
MPLTAELTSADLTQIRQSALGAADPLGVAADLADAADTGRLADPADAGLALTLAAEIAESRAKLEAAATYVERALEAYGKRDDGQVAAARALRARILFRTGREDEALAELEPLRPALTQYPDAAAYISAALAVGGRNRIAEQWLSEAVQSVLADRGSAAEPTDPDDAGLLFFLLQQRHRVRHAIGLPHDTHDNLAERLESKLTTAGPAAATEAPDLVFWAQTEFDQLGEVSAQYGGTFDGHRAGLERELVRLTAVGGTDLALLPGVLANLKKVGDPAEAKTRAAYARQLSASSARISWPPERNAACWCASGNKYKKCCLPRSRG